MKYPYLIIIFLLLSASCWADQSDPGSQARLTVRGEASLSVPADQVQLQFGVTSESASADDALQENSRAMSQLEKALNLAGLKKGEYSSGQFQLRPRWSSRPRNAQGDWRPQIVGYLVQNSLAIKTGRLEKIGSLIEVARKAGANEIGQIRFAIAEPRRYRQQAIAEAVANARADAQAAATAAGAKLGDLLGIALGPRGAPPVRPLGGDVMVRSMAAEAAPLIVAPDDLQVRASVNLEFALLSARLESQASPSAQ